jgi:hypothetical protein
VTQDFIAVHDGPELIASGRISGDLPPKANSRKIARHGSLLRVIKSREALAWAKRFRALAQATLLNYRFKPVEGTKDNQFELHVSVTYSSWRRDVEIELLKDVIQDAGIINNDRWITRLVVDRTVDRRTPRTEWRLLRRGEA